MSLKSYSCELDTDTSLILKLYLFKNVENVEDIRNNILQGVWKCAVIKPSLILTPFQVAVAANRAVVAYQQKTMVTRSVYTEILYNLSLSKNISQSLSKFGIEKDCNFLVCFLITADKDDSVQILSQIRGELCDINELPSLTNMEDLKTVYKLNKLNKKSVGDLIDIIVSRMVTKNFVSH